jgi:diguanylate cyclase (GGDEF)-like protein
MFDVILANWVLCIVSLIAGSLSVTTFRYKNLSEKDLFTGCYTKDWAMGRENSKLVKMMRHTIKNGTPFGIAIIDFDDFKDINDSQGHVQGDKIILEFVSVIKRVLKPKDIMVRFGGDELIIIVPNSRFSDFSNICNTIVYKTSYEVGHTVSVGGTLFRNDDPFNVQDLMNKIDSNVYQAKKQGKNRAIIS